MRPITSQWLNLDPYCVQREDSPENAVFGSVWFLALFSVVTEKNTLRYSTAKIWIVPDCAAIWAITEFLFVMDICLKFGSCWCYCCCKVSMTCVGYVTVNTVVQRAQSTSLASNVDLYKNVFSCRWWAGETTSVLVSRDGGDTYEYIRHPWSCTEPCTVFRAFFVTHRHHHHHHHTAFIMCLLQLT